MDAGKSSDVSGAPSELTSGVDRLPSSAGGHWRPAPFSVAMALCIHLAIGGAVLFGDWLREASALPREQEIPVEMVEEPPQPEAKRAPETAEVAKPEAPKLEAPKLEAPKLETARPEPVKTIVEAERPPQPARQAMQQPAGGQAGEQPAMRQSQPAPPESETEGPREPPPPPEATPSDEPASRKTEATERGTAAATLLFLRPESFGRIALPTAGKLVSDEYKGVVFERLERFKIEPAAAKARRISGVAVVSFSLDQSGNLVTVTLLRATGDRDLDTEAVAMVKRASPFPKPPPGALLTFTPSIHFQPD